MQNATENRLQVAFISFYTTNSISKSKSLKHSTENTIIFRKKTCCKRYILSHPKTSLNKKNPDESGF